MKRIIQSEATVDDGGETSSERAHRSDEGFVDELSEGSEALEVAEGDGFEPDGSAEQDDADADSFEVSRKPPNPLKSDVLGFVQATDDIEEGSLYLPGERWCDRPPARYVEIELVHEDGRLTRPGACILCYASKVMSGSRSPKMEVVGQLNAEGVDEFARRAFEIDPEEAKMGDGIDGLLS